MNCRVFTLSMLLAACSSNVSVDTTRLDFGDVGRCSTIERSFTLRNDGPSPVTLELSRVDEFTVTPNGTRTIAADASETVTVSIDGQRDSGPRETTIVIRREGEVVAQISLIAWIRSNENTLTISNFGEVVVGETRTSSEFSDGTLGTIDVPAFRSMGSQLHFMPTEVRSYSTRTTLNRENQCPEYVVLSGTGVEALRANELSLSTTNVHGAVTLTNRSMNAVALTDITIADGFTVTPTSLTLAARLGTATIDVTWNPSIAAPNDYALTMTTSAARQPNFTVPIHATAD